MRTRSRRPRARRIALALAAALFLGPHAVFATLFLPTASVTYLDGRSAPPDVSGGARAVFVRDVSAAELRSLLVELERSIQRAADGHRAPAVPARARLRGPLLSGAWVLHLLVRV